MTKLLLMRCVGMLLTCGWVLAVPPAAAGQTDSADAWRFAFGIGTGLGGGIGGGGLSSEGFAGFLEVVARRGSQRLALRYTGVTGPFAGPGALDLGLLYGVGGRGVGSPRVSAGAGVAVAYVEEKRLTLGLALSLRILFRLGKSVGLGTHGFADLNRHNGFAGGSVAVYFGELP